LTGLVAPQIAGQYPSHVWLLYLSILLHYYSIHTIIQFRHNEPIYYTFIFSFHMFRPQPDMIRCLTLPKLLFFKLLLIHLEHWASTKHSFHFSFLIFRQSMGLLELGINPSQGLYPHTGQHRHRINKYTHTTFVS
jgi:hypothetical protein